MIAWLRTVQWNWNFEDQKKAKPKCMSLNSDLILNKLRRKVSLVWSGISFFLACKVLVLALIHS